MNDDTNSQIRNLQSDLEFKEFPLNFNLLQLIPTRAQKGLSTFDIEVTCIDADGHYIVLGSNVGIVYLYDRQKHHLSRLRNDHKDVITTVKILLSLECLVVCGCKSGYVALFKVPFDAGEQIEKFTVAGLHNSSITSLEWAKNGLKFFSGDESGVVVCTEIEYFEHQSKSRVLLNEASKIVQLSYSKLHLVVSTLLRSLIYSFESNTCTKIGQKERKCFGPFGAIITRLNLSDGIIFASRPGQRLWKSNKLGIIQETMMFKNAISEPHPTILLEQEDTKVWNLTDFQFGQLKSYLDKYLIIYSDTSLILIDPEKKSIIASCPKLDPVIDLCSTNFEIFVLRGLRNLIRISTYTDPYVHDKDPVEPSLIEELLVPFKELSTFVKDRSDSLSAQTENANLFDWLRKKRSASTPSPLVVNSSNEKDNLKNSEILPNIIELKSDEMTPVLIDKKLDPSAIPSVEISCTEEVDEIVYKSLKKKKKKKVRFRSKSPKSDRKLLESHTADTTDCSVAINSLSNKDSSLCEDFKSDAQCKPDKLVLDASIESVAFTKDSDSLNENTQDQSSMAESSFDSSSILHANNLNNFDQELNRLNSSQNINDNPIQTINTNTSSEISITADIADKKFSIDEQKDTEDIYLSSDFTTSIDVKLESFISEDLCSLTSEEVSVTSGDTSVTEPLKYGAEWVEYKSPEVLLDLSISDHHIYCVDVKNKLYISHYPKLGMRWIELSQPAEKVAVSPADTIIWVLFKGTIYVAIQKSPIKWKDTEWMSIARDVISISLENDCGWYVTAAGQITKQSNLSELKPHDYPKPVHSDFTVSQISCRDKVLWALSSDGCLHCLNSINNKREKSKWKQIEFDSTLVIDNIYLGVHRTGWIIDNNGVIRFIIGVTQESPEGLGKPWEVEASKCLLSSSSQFQNPVMKALYSETFSSIIKGKQHISLSSSSYGVWFSKTFDNLVFANMKGVIGHMWDTVIPPSTSSSTKWSILAASGLSSAQESVWCVNAMGEIFCFCLNTNTLVAVESPSVSGIKCLVPSVHSLWLLSEDGCLYIRRGITSTCLQGVWWQNLDLSQLGSEKITHVSCSPEATWASSCEGHVFIRFGTLCPSSDRKLPQAWIPLSPEAEINCSPIVDTLSAIGKRFPLPLMNQNAAKIFFHKVCVGPFGCPVWAVDNKRAVFAREGVSSSFPIGRKWACVPGLKAKDLCISENGVWLLKNSGKIFRRFGVSEKNPCGDYWKQIPGKMDLLSVTQDDDLWGIKDELMFQHSSFLLTFAQDDLKKQPTDNITEDDWEDIMADASGDEM